MNILLISIDSLRIDYVSRTNPTIDTPRFDELTRNFCFYSGLFSASSATRPVHTSLFTGLYPFEHGVLGQSAKTMRSGIPHLFDQLKHNGYCVRCFSEVHEIFTGLNFAPFINTFHPTAVSQALRQTSQLPRFVFLHYWGAHTPYGAPDQSALGETARLLRSGRTHIVKQRYKRAVETVLERQIAPLLGSIDLRDWSVIIFSDHGESWTAEEPYHGYTLRNSVLRVPLYYHIPGTGNPSPTRPVASLIDLYPTLLNVMRIPNNYTGFATDLFQDADPHPYKLAQIHPDPMPTDLRLQDNEMDLFRQKTGPQWCLYNASCKYTFDEKLQRGRKEHPLSEEPQPLTEDDKQEYHSAMQEMVESSDRKQLPRTEIDSTDDILLDQRLRDLGYLE